MFEAITIQAGQAKAYQDSVYVYDVHSDMPEEWVKAKCLADYGCGAKQEHHAGPEQHSGAFGLYLKSTPICAYPPCGFPFGLDPFYSFRMVDEGHYRFMVTLPYTG